MFRHSRATNLASHLTEAQMKEYFGWAQSCKMASIYVHLGGRDTDKTVLRLHCTNCGRPLNMQAAMEAEAKERKLLEMITPQMIEEMVNKRVAELLAQHTQQTGGAL